jgi:hypothetical protein
MVFASGAGRLIAADEPQSGALNPGTVPVVVEPGPQLFIDDYLIAEQSMLSRTINEPDKLPSPVITGGQEGDANFQPWMSVLQDPQTHHFRMWYNVPQDPKRASQFEAETSSRLGYLESIDGIRWQRPYRVLANPVLENGAEQSIRFGASVLDLGPQFAPADRRYVLAFWYNGGTHIAVSADGFAWRMLSSEPAFRHGSDITTIVWDPLHHDFIGVPVMSTRDTGWGENWPRPRRIPYETTSVDLVHWEEPWPIIGPKVGAPAERGATDFYSMAGVIARGDLLIGLVKVLHDDRNATPGRSGREMGDPNPNRTAAGMGYTVLAWSRDGRHWQRDSEPFLANDPQPDAWDHAMAWGSAQLIVGDETFVYYAGYKNGHKIERATERQFGLARMARDRYVAREADVAVGRLVTKPLALHGRRLTVNARVVGEMEVRLLDQAGAPQPDFGWLGVKGDGVDLPLPWLKELAAIHQPVQLEFRFRDAQLFGFDLE